MHILLIEDNPDILANAMDYLESKGHTVDCAYDGLAGLRLAQSGSFDAIVLDLMLPKLDGISLCQRLRIDYGMNTPILMLTARDTLDDKLRGFEVGADDYLVKPYALAELEARLKALCRRPSNASNQNVLTIGKLSIDIAKHEILREGVDIKLPPLSFKLLVLLARHAPNVVRKEEITRELWGDEPPNSDALRVHLHQLRQLVDKPFSTAMICTVAGVGARLDNPYEY